MSQTLIQTQPLVNTEAERIYNQMVDCVTAHFDRFPGLVWEETFQLWQQAWSDDRGVDITGFPIAPAPVAINEDAADWFTSISTGINQF